MSAGDQVEFWHVETSCSHRPQARRDTRAGDSVPLLERGWGTTEEASHGQ